jgi:hypothetical protein
LTVRVVATKLINAPAEAIFAHVRQLDRMPERSPEAHRFEWLSGTPGDKGAAFRGWNQSLGMRWWTNGWITDVEAPHLFAFETSTIYGARQERTNRWEYRFEPEPPGTRVTESLHSIRLPFHLKLLGPFLGFRWLQIKSGMVQTLDRLAQECESESGQAK